MPESWERLLKGITPDQIKNGLNRLSERQEAWPPNAVEFRNLCLPETISPNGHNSAAYLMFNDPRHPRNDPASPEYCPKPKGIESDGYKSARKERWSRNVKNMLEGL